jgi:hypothetical protein
MVVVEGGVELVRPMDAAAIDDHPALLPGLAAGRHHWMDLLAPCPGINRRDDLREACGGALLDGTENAAPHPAGAAAPRALRGPRWARARLFPLAVALAPRARGQAGTLAVRHARIRGLAEEGGMSHGESGAVEGAGSPWAGVRPSRGPRTHGVAPANVSKEIAPEQG